MEADGSVSMVNISLYVFSVFVGFFLVFDEIIRHLLPAITGYN